MSAPKKFWLITYQYRMRSDTWQFDNQATNLNPAAWLVRSIEANGIQGAEVILLSALEISASDYKLLANTIGKA